MSRQKFNFQPTQSLPPQSEKSDDKEISPSTTQQVSEMMERLEAPRQTSPLDCFKIIPRNKLRNNKKNDFPMSELESLKESILQFGLQHDITAAYITDEDMYVIEAGHRRRLVIDQLIEEFSKYTGNDSERYALYKKNIAKYEYGYVCKITGTILENECYDIEDEDLPEDAIDSEIRLIITNTEVRSNDTLLNAVMVQRLAKLYSLKNLHLPTKEKINVNQTIANELGKSVRSIAYLQSIKNLIPELQQALSEKNISLKESSFIAGLSPEEQQEFLELLNSSTKDGRKKLKAALAEKQALKKELESIQASTDSSQIPMDIIKADAAMRLSLEQVQTNILALLEKISFLQKLQADMNSTYGSSQDDIQNAKNSLAALLK